MGVGFGGSGCLRGVAIGGSGFGGSGRLRGGLL